MDKCVFVISSEHGSELESTLQRYFVESRPPVFVFDSEGRIDEPKRFADQLTPIVTRALGQWALDGEPDQSTLASSRELIGVSALAAPAGREQPKASRQA